MSPAGPPEPAPPRPDPAAPAELRLVLGAAAAGAGLALAPAGDPDVLDDAGARQTAAAWGLLEGSGRDPRRGGGVVVVLVDGLGLELLRERRGHAPTLRSWLAEADGGSGPGPRALTCLPTTTASALTTLGTGAAPGVTGVVGYSVLTPRIDRARLVSGPPGPSRLLCLITWEGGDAPDPAVWQDVPTIFERLRRPDGPGGVDAERADSAGAPAPAVTIGPARFAGSGLTRAALRGCPHLGADRMEARPALAAGALRRGTPLVYLYVGELDHAGHLHGWRSAQWLDQLERLDAVVAELVRRVPAGTRIVLTADHGMVDTDADRRVDVTAHPDLARDVVAVAGEPRFTQLYVPGSDPEIAARVAGRWRDLLGERAAWVGTRDEAPAGLGPLGPRARGVLGDVLVAMDGNWVVVDPRVHGPSAIAMPGVHGSVTTAERDVPLLLALA